MAEGLVCRLPWSLRLSLPEMGLPRVPAMMQPDGKQVNTARARLLSGARHTLRRARRATSEPMLCALIALLLLAQLQCKQHVLRRPNVLVMSGKQKRICVRNMRWRLKGPLAYGICCVLHLASEAQPC